MVNTGSISMSGTLPEQSGREVSTSPAPAHRMISTVAHHSGPSLPVTLPDSSLLIGAVLPGFLVRVSPGTTTVTLRLDPRRLARQAEVRKANEEIRRSSQG